MKFQVSGNLSIITLCAKFNFPRCYLCICILAKLTITDNIIRNLLISKRSKENNNYNENDSYLEESTDNDFSFLDGFYGHSSVN